MPWIDAPAFRGNIAEVGTPNKLAEYVSEIRRRAKAGELANEIRRDLLRRGIECSDVAVQRVAYDPRRYTQGPEPAISPRNFRYLKRPLTDQERLEIRVLREAGIPAGDVAEAYQVGRRTVARIAPVGSDVVPTEVWEYIRYEVLERKRRAVDLAREYHIRPKYIHDRLSVERRRAKGLR